MATSSPVNNADWHIEPDELAEVVIRWPAEYQWPTARLWVDTILFGLKEQVRVETAPLAQPYRGIVLFQFVRRGETQDVVIDYSDYPEVNEEAVARCPLYFKMQHFRDGYGRDNIVPGGYVCDGRKIYLHLARLRRLRDLSQFEFEVYGRFSTEFAREKRERAVEMLSSQRVFKFEGGLKKVKYLDFLKEVARAKVCIDLPGQGDFCFRLINYLAVGACVVGPRPRTVLPVPLVDRVHVAYAKEDLSDLVDLCQFYVENDNAREEMCRNSRRYFDEHLHRNNLTSYYLRSCLDRLN
jgi:hypothetical protein